MDCPVIRWIDQLHTATLMTEVTEGTGRSIPIETAVEKFRTAVKLRIVERGGRIILFGNGGSLAIASHLATDFALVGWPSIALTDAVAITSHTNDFGPNLNFAKQLALLRIRWDDIVIGMSCSGKSQNIIAAMEASHSGFNVTLSGFAPDNPLRGYGELNFYVPSTRYGFVQLAHESILHAACDIEGGWGSGD